MMNPTDDEVKKQEIIDQLIWDDSVDANDVLVSVRSGIAELTGSVPTYAAKMAAERDASLIDGIIKVDNKLTIYCYQLFRSFIGTGKIIESKDHRINQARINTSEITSLCVSQ